MERIFWEAVEENPIIAAVKNMEDLEKCCSLSDIHVVFILFGDICSIADIVQKVKEAGKIAMIHVDLIGGLSTREIAVEFLKNNTEADGIHYDKAGIGPKGQRTFYVYGTSLFPFGFDGIREYSFTAAQCTS